MTAPDPTCRSCHDGRDLAVGWECSGCHRTGEVERAAPDPTPAPAVEGLGQQVDQIIRWHFGAESSKPNSGYLTACVANVMSKVTAALAARDAAQQRIGAERALREFRVSIQEVKGQPTTCKVWRHGALVFSGYDHSADLFTDRTAALVAQAERIGAERGWEKGHDRRSCVMAGFREKCVCPNPYRADRIAQEEA